jgi:hypothetical protein
MQSIAAIDERRAERIAREMQIIPEHTHRLETVAFVQTMLELSPSSTFRNRVDLRAVNAVVAGCRGRTLSGCDNRFCGVRER